MSPRRRYHPPDELSEEQRDRMCPSCGVRYRWPAPEVSTLYGLLDISPAAYRWLVKAAAYWDSLDEEDYPAADFMAWVRFDIVGQRRPFIEADGAPARFEGGQLAPRSDGSAHRHPFPLAQVAWRPSRREG